MLPSHTPGTSRFPFHCWTLPAECTPARLWPETCSTVKTTVLDRPKCCGTSTRALAVRRAGTPPATVGPTRGLVYGQDAWERKSNADGRRSKGFGAVSWRLEERGRVVSCAPLLAAATPVGPVEAGSLPRDRPPACAGAIVPSSRSCETEAKGRADYP